MILPQKLLSGGRSSHRQDSSTKGCTKKDEPAGLLDRIPGTKNPHPNRLSEEIEKAILDYSLKNPSHGCVKVS